MSVVGMMGGSMNGQMGGGCGCSGSNDNPTPDIGFNIIMQGLTGGGSKRIKKKQKKSSKESSVSPFTDLEVTEEESDPDQFEDPMMKHIVGMKLEDIVNTKQ